MEYRVYRCSLGENPWTFRVRASCFWRQLVYKEVLSLFSTFRLLSFSSLSHFLALCGHFSGTKGDFPSTWEVLDIVCTSCQLACNPPLWSTLPCPPLAGVRAALNSSASTHCDVRFALAGEVACPAAKNWGCSCLCSGG